MRRPHVQRLCEGKVETKFMRVRQPILNKLEKGVWQKELRHLTPHMLSRLKRPLLVETQRCLP
jgi:hypothetical protein